MSANEENIDKAPESSPEDNPAPEDTLNDMRPEEILDKYRKKMVTSSAEKSGDSDAPARRCLFALLDTDSFNESGGFTAFSPEDILEDEKISGDGISCGFGKINNRNVGVVLFDHTVKQGTFSGRNCRVLNRFISRVRRQKLPLVLIVDSLGIRADEKIAALAETAEVLGKLDSCAGEIPRICLVAGHCQHTAGMLAGLSDVVIGINKSTSSADNDENMDRKEALYDLEAVDREEAVELTIKCLNYLPDNSDEYSFVLQGEPPSISENPGEIVPADKRQPYDAKEVIRSIVDGRSFLEIKAGEARNIVTGFVRLKGRSAGIIANQPRFCAGTLDGPASSKAANFLEFCDDFNFPVISFVDLPGFLPVSEREQEGIINRAARLFSTYCRVEVPLVTLITRKSYDTAYTIMGAPAAGVDYICAWPGAEVAITKNVSGGEESGSDFYQFGDPWEAAGEGYIDKIIKPEETRDLLSDLIVTD